MRKTYKGNVVATALSGAITSGATSISVLDGSTYPDGSAGPFFVVIDKGMVGEEKILVTTRVGNAFTVVARGQDGTVATTHAGGATVSHCFTATDADEANAHVNATTNVHGVTGALVGVSAVGAAFSYIPTWTANTNPSLGNGTLVGSYRSAGGIVRGNFTLTIGTTTTFGSGAWVFTLPSNPAAFAPAAGNILGRVGISHSATGYTRDLFLNGGSSVLVKDDTNIVSGVTPFTWVAGDIISADFCYFT